MKPVRRSELLEAIGGRPGRETDSDTRPAGDEGNAGAPAGERTLRILLADDSDNNRFLVRGYLKDSGYNIDEAENGSVAVKKFKQAAYDLVLLTDVEMPVLDGFRPPARCGPMKRNLYPGGARTGRGRRPHGDHQCGGAVLRRLAEATQPGGNDLALGVEARCRALLSDGKTAERLYHEAIDRLGRTQLRPDLARAHLLYGEWLRRQARRVDARQQLRTAYDMLTVIGMAVFAERARGS